MSREQSFITFIPIGVKLVVPFEDHTFLFVGVFLHLQLLLGWNGENCPQNLRHLSDMIPRPRPSCLRRARLLSSRALSLLSACGVKKKGLFTLVASTTSNMKPPHSVKVASQVLDLVLESSLVGDDAGGLAVEPVELLLASVGLLFVRLGEGGKETKNKAQGMNKTQYDVENKPPARTAISSLSISVCPLSSAFFFTSSELTLPVAATLPRFERVWGGGHSSPY